MGKLLEKSRYLVLVGVVCSLVATVAAFAWGAVKTGQLIIKLVQSYGQYEGAKIAFLELMDGFLIAAALLVFTLGLFELFVARLDLPGWLIIRNLHDLKAKIGSVAVLVMAITFLEHLVEWKDPQGTFWFALAIGVVSAALIAFNHLGDED